MKVLHIVESLSVESGGLSRAVAGLSEALSQRAAKVEIITTTSRDEIQMRPGGVEVHVFRRGPLSWWGNAPGLRPAIESAVQQADIVHIHGLWQYPGFIASRTARNAGKPYLISPHGMMDKWALSHKKFRKRIYSGLIEWRTIRQSDAVHALTESEASDLKRLRFAIPVTVIPNGIDRREFAKLPDRSMLSERYPALIGKKVILFLGRIHPKKGLDLLVRAFCEISKERDGLILLIVGPDEVGHKKQLEIMLEAEGAKNRYIFTGMLQGDERLAALAAADIFILPSYSEGFPIALIEAMAAGLPVVISDRINVRHDVNAYNSGLVAACNVRQISSAIEELLDNDVLRKEMGDNGKSLVCEKFSWEVVAPQVINLYEQVLSGRYDHSGN